MMKVIQELTAHLAKAKDRIVRGKKIYKDVPAMTDGFVEWHTLATIEVVDFDALLKEMDMFAQTFGNKTC